MFLLCRTLLQSSDKHPLWRRKVVINKNSFEICLRSPYVRQRFICRLKPPGWQLLQGLPQSRVTFGIWVCPRYLILCFIAKQESVRPRQNLMNRPAWRKGL